jgi:hypothetical protein
MIANPIAKLIFRRRQAWQATMLNERGELTPDGRVIMRDLARFCRAHRSTAVFSHIRGVLDPLASARADGRREVYLRIVENLHLDERFLVNLREGANDND